MGPQVVDQWINDMWLTHSCQPQPLDTLPDPLPDYFCPTPEYDARAFEGFSMIADPPSAYHRPISSTSSDFRLPSPISSLSSFDLQDLFEEMTPTYPTDPTASDNYFINSTTPLATPPEESVAPHILPEFVSSSQISGPSVLPRAKHGFESKKPAKQGRRQEIRCSRASSSGLSGHKGHNIIEKRYRQNLNNKIYSLCHSIPSPHFGNGNQYGDGMDTDLCKNKNFRRVNKGLILDKAIAYIAELTKRNEDLSTEIYNLRLIIGGSPDYYAYGGPHKR